MRRWLRRLGLGLLVVLAAVLLLVVGAWLFVTSGPGERMIRERVVTAVNDALPGNIDAGGLDLSANTLILTDVVLRDPEGNVVARIARLEATYGPLSLASGRIILDRVHLTRPELYLVLDERGLNLLRAVSAAREEVEQEDGGGPPPDIQVRELRIEDGLVDLRQSTIDALAPHTRIEDLDVEGDLRLIGKTNDLRGSVKLTSDMVAPLQGPVVLETELSSAARSLSGALALKVDGLELAAAAKAEGTEEASLTIESLNAPHGTLRALLPTWPLIADATLTGTAVRRGNLAQVDLRVTAADAEVRVKGGVDVARLRAEDLSVEATRLDFSKLVADGPASDIELRLRASGGGTSLETLDGKIDLTVPKARLADQTFGPIELHATASDGNFHISELDARVPGATLTARGEGNLERIDVTGRFEARDLALLGNTLGRIVQPGGLPLSGRGALTFTLEGPPRHPGVSANGAFAHLRYDTYRVQDLSLDASLADVRRPLDVDAKLRAGLLEADERRFRDLRADVVTRGRELTADLTASGFADVSLHLAGTVDEDRQGLQLADLQLRYPEATWRLQRPAHVSFGDTLAVRDLTLEAGRQRLTVDGWMRGTRLKAEAVIENLDVSRLPGVLMPDDLKLAGTIDAIVAASGTTSNPTATVRVDLRNGRVDTFDDLALAVNGTYEKGRAAGDLTARALHTGIRGTFDLPVTKLFDGGSDPVALDLVVEETELARLFAALGVETGVSGRVAATLRVENTIGDPRVRFVVDGDHIHQEAGPPADLDLIVESSKEGTLVARIDLDTMGSQNFLLLRTPFRAGQFLSGPVTAEMFLETPVELEAAFRDVPLEVLRAWNVLSAEMGGTASLTVKAQGPARAPTGTLHMAVKGATTEALQPMDAYATVQATGDRITLTLTALRGQHRLADIGGGVEAPVARFFDGADWEQLAVHLDGELGPLTLRELQSLSGGDEPALESREPDGLLRAKLSVRGTAADPVAEVQLDAEKLGVGQVALGEVDLRYRYEDAVSVANVVLTSSKGGRLQLDARTWLDLSSKGLKNGLAWEEAPVEATLVSNGFDPSFLSNVVDTVREVAGRIDANAQVRGTLGRPKLNGRVEWQGGRLALMGYGQYRNIHLAMQGSNDAFVLEDLTAESGGGELKVAARADRRGDPFVLAGSGQFDRFPVINDDQLEAILTGNFKLSGELTSDLVFIRDLSIPELHVELPEVRRKDLQDLERPADIILVRRGEPLYRKRKRQQAEAPSAAGGSGGAPNEEAEGDAGGMRYTVLVNAPRNVWIRGTDVNAEIGLSDNFRVEMSDRLSLFGEVRFLRGRIDVLGRRFDVMRDSQVRFAGPASVPYINITAEHQNEREQVTVFTTIRGQGKEVTVKVSSTPALSESEIYTLLATGRRTLKRGSGASMTGAEAASVVGAYAASQIKRVIASKVPLDVISIEAGAEGLTDASLEAGTYLTDKIYVGSILRLGADPEKGENAAGFRIEYQFSPRWSFETEYGTAQSGGADLIWSRDF